MSNQATIPWSRRSIFWGHIVGMASLLRAASYAVIPPAPSSLSSRTFENIFSYGEWAWILLVLGGAMNLFTAFQSARLAFISHLCGFFIYLVFAYSSLTGIFEWIAQDDSYPFSWIELFRFGSGVLVLQQGWVGIFPLIIVALLNGERCLTLGVIIRLEASARRARDLHSRDESI